MVVAEVDPRLWYLTLVVLVVASVVGVVIAHRVWREAHGEVEAESDRPEDLLAPLAEAFAAGQMSEEEYARIRASLGRPIQPWENRSLRPRPPRPEPTPGDQPPPKDQAD